MCNMLYAHLADERCLEQEKMQRMMAGDHIQGRVG